MPKEHNSVIPFTEEDLARFKDIEQKLADLLPVFDKCEACGKSMSASRELHANVSEALRNFRHQFFSEQGKP